MEPQLNPKTRNGNRSTGAQLKRLEFQWKQVGRTMYTKDHFNGPKYLEQLSLHSCKREKNEKIWQNSSHLEFHSIFNQDGITNSPKKSAVSKGKKGKTSSPTEVFKNLFKCDWKHPEHLKAGHIFFCRHLQKKKVWGGRGAGGGRRKKQWDE